ncbi:MAG: N-acetyl-gamma-glutamyl-phosphate reductase, partial [Syntrophomonadaceae bacterium]|nr:N-acetyl-gamma-glutamyl-phosphate reductase [Syntrophomonadaceae bacterium]
MIPVAIIGDGYTAADLLRLLAGHGEAVAVRIGSTENVGRPVAEVYPHLAGFTDLVCEETDLEAWGKECQAAFLALPHGLSVPIAQRLLRGGVRCIDLGADFRLKDAALYQRFYEMEHAAPELLETAVY